MKILNLSTNSFENIELIDPITGKDNIDNFFYCFDGFINHFFSQDEQNNISATQEGVNYLNIVVLYLTNNIKYPICIYDNYDNYEFVDETHYDMKYAGYIFNNLHELLNFNYVSDLVSALIDGDKSFKTYY